MSNEIDRVKIWNSYLCEAHKFASKLKNSNSLDCPKLKGETLLFEDHYSLMTILHLALAIEARTNHLLFELKEKGTINIDLRESVEYLNGKRKWAILPRIAGKKKIIDFESMPHNSIKEIYKHRDRFVHVLYSKKDFIDRIPDKNETIQLYNNFIEAMWDMNVILGRSSKEGKLSVMKKLKV